MDLKDPLDTYITRSVEAVLQDTLPGCDRVYTCAGFLLADLHALRTRCCLDSQLLTKRGLHV